MLPPMMARYDFHAADADAAFDDAALSPIDAADRGYARFAAIRRAGGALMRHAFRYAAPPYDAAFRAFRHIYAVTRAFATPALFSRYVVTLILRCHDKDAIITLLRRLMPIRRRRHFSSPAA